MAFTLSANTSVLLQAIGVYPQLAYGSVALAAGSAVVTIPNAREIKMAVASSQTANAGRVSDITGNTLTITGTGTDRVDWIAVVVSK